MIWWGTAGPCPINRQTIMRRDKMDEVNTENGQIYELAEKSDRVIALIIDSIIVGILGSILGIGTGNILVGGSVLGFILGAGYQWYFLTQHDGQTFGKMVRDIRIIKMDGTKITETDAVMRFIGYMVNSIPPGIIWLWPFIDDDGRGLHDRLANTVVVKLSEEEKEKTKNSDF
jgi:uncharacterized RDD family membrane protein YckC